MTAVVLTLAGSDPSGGAGIQADLKTFAAHGAFGASVLTALTAQNTRGVRGVHPVPPEFVRAQAEAVLEDLDVAAVKVGMLGEAAVVREVARLLAARPDLPVVLDPVMVAAGGEPLLRPEAVAALREELLPLATVVTPNVHEAALLLGQAPIREVSDLVPRARALHAAGARAVLLKGGRLGSSGPCVDAWVSADGERLLEAPRIPVERPHGTGCTLSSAIAAGLASGLGLEPAVLAAREFVRGALERALRVRIGHGARPLIHHRGDREG